MLRTRCFVMSLSLVAMLALPAAAAELEFDRMRHDFGDIGHYDKPEVIFTFKNVGAVPVKIRIVKSSNLVGRPVTPKGEIAPNETGEIFVKARTRYGGPFRFHLFVVEQDDEGRDNSGELVVTGNVLAREDSVKPE